MERDSYIFYKSFHKLIEIFDDATQLQIYRAITEYSLYHQISIELNVQANAVFESFKPQIEANFKKYMAGAKGGKSKAKPSEELGDKANQDYNHDSNQDYNHDSNQDYNHDSNQDYNHDGKHSGKQKASISEANENVNVNDNVNVNKKEISKEKKIFGEFKNVKLTEDEYDKLAKDYPVDTLIQILDEAKEQHGYRYKSDYLAIKNWVVKEYESRNNKTMYSDKDNIQISDKQLADFRARRKDIQVTYDSSKNKPVSDEELEAIKKFRESV